MRDAAKKPLDAVGRSRDFVNAEPALAVRLEAHGHRSRGAGGVQALESLGRGRCLASRGEQNGAYGVAERTDLVQVRERERAVTEALTLGGEPAT